MDYNKDIPFHAPAPVGFWDTAQEKVREAVDVAKAKEGSGPVSLTKLDGKNRYAAYGLVYSSLYIACLLTSLSFPEHPWSVHRFAQEEQARRHDAKRVKLAKADGSYVSAAALKAAREADLAVSRGRRKLELPSPQVGDRDIEEIVKIGRSGQTAVDASGPTTGALVSDYSAPGMLPPPRTPRVDDTDESVSVKTMARDLRAMVQSQTPLMGESVILSEQGRTGTATPRSAVSTPNPIAEARRATDSSSSSKTPLRDRMGINTPADGSGDAATAASSSFAEPERRSVDLAALFRGLPAPANDFEIVIPDVMEASAFGATDGFMVVPDAEDISAERAAQRDAARARELAKRSLAVRLGLPRPGVIPDLGDGPVQVEMVRLMRHDAIVHPAPGQKSAAGQKASPLEEFSAARMRRVDELIADELAAGGYTGVDDYDAFSEARDREWGRYMFFPPASGQKGPGVWKEVATMTEGKKQAELM